MLIKSFCLIVYTVSNDTLIPAFLQVAKETTRVVLTETAQYAIICSDHKCSLQKERVHYGVQTSKCRTKGHVRIMERG